MRPAPDNRRLRQRLERFLNDNPATEAVELRKVLDKHFLSFDGVGVIGGLVRDVARGGRRAFKSDVDLVVDGDPAEVDALARRLDARPNRFGGYGFAAGPWRIDFWALRSTWAAANGLVKVKALEDVIRCTFFDWDAAVYDYKSRALHCARGYTDRIREGRMDIVLRPNPGELGNLLRAARRILAWRLEAGPGLRAFIEERLDDAAFEAIRTAERRKHGAGPVSAFTEAGPLRVALLESCRPEAALARDRQLKLPTLLE